MATELRNILDGLNEAQVAAATSDAAAILCIAGAGSGKTQTLAARVAHLVTTKRYSPHNILVLTFTNKAAREMQERIVSILGDERAIRGMWIGTFHSICARIVREWADRIGLKSDFTIYDEEDRRDILTYIIKNRRKCKVKPQVIVDFMNEVEGLRKEIREDTDDEALDILMEYNRFLRDSNALDFHGILIAARDLLRDNLDIQEHYRKKFHHVLIDEYQDTNPIQDEIIRLIAPRNLFAVGDDYQSIYRFRGADMRIMIAFEGHHPGAEIIRLVKNYRSRPSIVYAANRLIAHNREQLHKTLEPVLEEGRVESSFEAFGGVRDEADWIANEAFKGYGLSGEWGNKAILARTHRYLNFLEDALQKREIPYQRLGGRDIWATEPARICIAFLRVLRNPDDNWSMGYLLRRLAGLTQLEMLDIREHRLRRDRTILEAARELATARCPWDPIVGFFDEYGFNPPYHMACQIITVLLENIPVEKMYLKQHRDTKAGLFRTILSELELWEGQQLQNRYTDFLDWLAARSVQDSMQADDTVKLATIHAAKGLEWPVVYVAGCHEGNMPYSKAAGSDIELEEERRLMYVAMTRAKDHLVVTTTHTDAFGRPVLRSRFLSEIQPVSKEG
jgi:DNA helicase-2/ATP-dependent DNA helicase PcrA